MRTIFSYLLIASCSLLYAQSFNKAKLDSFITILEKEQQAMGTLSISKNGKEIYTRSFGMASLDPKVENTPKTKYRIGSISKTFTAVIILQMVAEGKLTLETKVADFFPNLPNAKSISIHHLLSHSSGLHNFTNDDDYLEYMTKPKTREEKLTIIKKGGIDFKPGAKYEYSNTNYVLLSLIAEDVDKKPLGEILDARIVKPLQLTDTYYGKPIDIERNEASSYGWSGNWIKSTETDMSIPMGAGAIVSTPENLNKFFYEIFTGNLLSTEMISKMKNMNSGYGYGLFQFPFNSKVSFGHTGGIDAFQSVASYFPDEDLNIALCLNGAVYPMNDVVLGALSIYFGEEFDLPSFEKYEITEAELKKYEGIYGAEGFPFKITIKLKDGTLTGQATGQPAFPLEAFDKHKFRFRMAGLEMHFKPEEDKMIFKQGGNTQELTRK